MRAVYFDTGSGISGDMTVAALLDAGRESLDVTRLRAALALLDVSGFEIEVVEADVCGIRALSFRVRIDENVKQPHRDWRTIRSLLRASSSRGMPAGVVDRSVAVFGALAEAEANVHRVPVDAVHFHEVGAVDSILDVVATAWCLDELGIENCFVGPLPAGSGYADTEHGRLPVPAPATVELLRGFEVAMGDGVGELVTPTGAAILQALATPMRPVLRLERVGVGAGSRRLDDRPNVLRAVLGTCEDRDDRNVVVIEADIDDMTPAALACVAERLRREGARDVSLVPTVAKKGRLGIRLGVICDVADVRRFAELILNESSTIGIRYHSCGRVVLPRRIELVETEVGRIAVKVVRRPDGRETAEPETDDVVRAAITNERPLHEVRDAALAAWRRKGGRD